MPLDTNPIAGLHLTRRGLLGAGAALVLTETARAQPAALGNGGPATVINSQLQRLAPNAYAFLLREAKGQSNLSISNLGCVVGPTSMLAIDTGGAPQHARDFIAATRSIGKSFDRIVITHEHPDHIAGLSQFPAGLEIVAQEETRAQMVKMGQPDTPPYWATNPAWGRPGDVNRVILPTATFHDRMTLYYGDTEVNVVWPGRAHTSGDAVVLLPSEKIAFLGDVAFFDVTPLNGSGFVADWIKACDRLLGDPNIQTIVPGHGPVGGKAELEAMRGYLALLLREGRKGYDRGVSAGRAAAEIELGKYATWTNPERIAPNMARLYSEFAGTIGPDLDLGAAGAAMAEYNRLKGKG